MATKRWTVWQQDWIGRKPRKFGTYESEEAAKNAAKGLNAAPCGEWYHYFAKPPVCDSVEE